MTEEQLEKATKWLDKTKSLSKEIEKIKHLLDMYNFTSGTLKVNDGYSTEVYLDDKEVKQCLGIHLDNLNKELKIFKDKIEKL